MNLDYQRIGAAAARLAECVPYSAMVSLAETVALNSAKDWPTARQAILQSLESPNHRNATADFLDLWSFSADSVGVEALVAALATAAECEHEHRRKRAISQIEPRP
jgi:hypothetical protein